VQTHTDLFASLVSDLDWGGRATRAEVDLGAVRENVRSMRRATTAREMLVVVKSDGYGHGAVAVGRASLESGATRLGVYTVDEGVSLRRAGISAPILVFGPWTEPEAVEISRHDLTATLTNLEAARTLQQHAYGRTVRYHVKLDTGLTRNGVMPDDVVDLMDGLRAFSSLEPEGIFTHFARSDEVDKTSTEKQFRRYTEAVAALEARGHTFALKHVAASGSLHDLPHMHLDMVRTGISAYGYYPSNAVRTDIPLRPALQLVSAVSRIHMAAPGTGVGYGHEFVADRPTPIALVPIGYGDGLPRTFGRGAGRVLINGRAAPVVARVSMDQITVDVSDAGEVCLGDEVVLVGRSGDSVQTADDVAAQTGTINYDILCGIMPRVPRVYVDGGVIVGSTRYFSPAPTPADGADPRST
jgi:alanine racemase